MVLSRAVKKAAGKLEKRPAEAPKTSMDMVLTLAEAMRFGYAETLGKWDLLDMPRAILYAIMEKILKPAFTVIRDKESKCLFVFIRGTREITDTLTDVIGASVSFNHFICSDGELKKNNLISGHGHRGMVAAAGWIKKHCTPKLLDELRQYPDFQVKIVGHSLGGAACMSLELAEFGKPFVTSIINGYDMVPTLSASSVHDFVSEIVQYPVAPSEGSDNDDMDEEDEKIISATHNISNDELNQYLKELQLEAQDDYPNTDGAKEKEAATKESTTEAEMNEKVVHIEKRAGSTVETSDKPVRHPLYPPGRVLHIVPALSTGNSKSNDNDDGDEKHVVLYETGRELYGKLRLSRGMLFDHMTGKYLKVVQQVRHPLYPPGRVLHIVPALSTGNSKSNDNDDGDEKHVVLYETGRELYGKLRLSRGMLFDHMTGKYLKVVQQLINQLEKEKFHYGA
ncbi:hypothetical protein VNO80_09014 [Phaseolus coccineus]|uniref:Fungal lipase-type domain-containing protein n=1 Tax=Phaseolus coccineus TaxID=3886 RepID=A0AAN9RDA9_PHACN